MLAAAAINFALTTPSTETAPEPRSLPLKPFRGLATVPIQIGDSQPLDFVIDSGSEHTSLNDTDLAKALGLHTRQAGLGRGMGGTKLQVLIAPDVAIRSFDGELFRTDLAVHHLSSLLADQSGRDLHGLLGSSLFERYVVEINPALGTVLLHDPSRFSYNGSGHVIPLIIDQRRPFVKARVTTAQGKSVRVRLMVDTGSETHLALILGSHRHLKVPEQHLQVTALGVGGEVEAFVGPVSSLEMESPTLGRTPATFFASHSVPAAQSIRKFNGLVGNGLLGQYRMILDYHRKQLVLESYEPVRGASSTATR